MHVGALCCATRSGVGASLDANTTLCDPVRGHVHNTPLDPEAGHTTLNPLDIAWLDPGAGRTSYRFLAKDVDAFALVGELPAGEGSSSLAA